MLYQNSVRVAPGVRSAFAVACGLALSVSGVAWADDEGLGPVVVSVSRMPQPVSRVLADVSIIDREAIELSSGNAVADVLRNLPGIEMTRNGGATGTTSIFLRGSDKRHVLVLVDGVPFDSQASGGATWEALPLQSIERIEVLRGPASAAYGSDAVAGVIQIFTRKGEGPPRFDVGFGGGDLGLASTDIGVLGRQGDVDYALSVAAERSRGFDSRTNTTKGSRAADRDGYASNSYQMRLGYRLDPRHRLQGSVVRQHQNSQYDGTASSPNDDRSLKDASVASLSWAAQWTEGWKSTLTLGQSKDDYELRPNAYNTHTQLRTASWLNHLTLGSHAFLVIMERREDQLLNSDLPQSPTGKKAERSNNGLGIGYEGQEGPLTFASNVRSDSDSEFGNRVTGSLALGIELNRHWRLRGSTGTAFKAPTLYQRFSQYGNPVLKPEAARNKELGLRFQDGGTQVSATLFDSQLKDLIDYSTPGICPSTDGCYRNVVRARLKGLEIQGGMSLGAVRLTGSMDWTSPKNLDTDRILTRRARRHASMRTEVAAGEWLWGAQANSYSGRLDYTGATGAVKHLGGYTLWTADVSAPLSREWKWAVRVDNVTDKRYQTASTYATQPRTLFVSARWSPGL
jgi:vitamin B12 transporter